MNLEGALRKQHELEHMLDVGQRDSQAMRMQLKIAVEAVQRCGEERAASSPELSRLRIELEAAVRERECLKDQIHNSQVVSYLTVTMKFLYIFISLPSVDWLVWLKFMYSNKYISSSLT
jgi:hypothetical protein